MRTSNSIFDNEAPPTQSPAAETVRAIAEAVASLDSLVYQSKRAQWNLARHGTDQPSSQAGEIARVARDFGRELSHQGSKLQPEWILARRLFQQRQQLRRISNLSAEESLDLLKASMDRVIVSVTSVLQSMAEIDGTDPELEDLLLRIAGDLRKRIRRIAEMRDS